jgi:hypothetical protein
MYRDKTRRKRDMPAVRHGDDQPRSARSSGDLSEGDLRRAAVGVL